MSNAAALYRKLDQGQMHHRAGQFDLAEFMYREVIAADANNAEAYYLLGALAQARQDFAASAAHIGRALALNPKSPRYHIDYASALVGLKRFEDARKSLDDAVALNPEYSDAWFARGVFRASQEDYNLALADLAQAMVLSHDDGTIHFYRGQVLYNLHRLPQAAHSLATAAAIHPDNPDNYYFLGLIDQSQGRWADALENFQKAATLKSTRPFLAGAILQAKMHVCDWSSYDDDIDAVMGSLHDGAPVITPPALLALPATLDQLRRSADAYAQMTFTAVPQLFPKLDPAAADKVDGKIRIGYFSPDFHTHHIAMAIARTVEGHAREKFEVLGFSFGPADPDPWRDRLEKAFDQFIDVRGLTDAEVVAKARDLQLDVAIDLAGYAPNARPGIFARRAAPIQIGLFGYPATLGQGPAGPVLDYIVADATVIADAEMADYAEKIIFMSHGFQVTDRKRAAPAVIRRADVGLPDDAFVFGAFHAGAKFNPDMFDVWLSILRQAPHSVLWLLSDGETQAANLKAYAQSQGIAATRLIFADRLAHDAHMSRVALVDCMLDTLPFNGNATTVDALVAGVPVLTCVGRTYAGRIGASLLKVGGLPELVAASLADYESYAIQLAQSPEHVPALKQHLNDLRGRTVLFNTGAFTLDFEIALTQIVQTHRAGQPAVHLHLGNA